MQPLDKQHRRCFYDPVICEVALSFETLGLSPEAGLTMAVYTAELSSHSMAP